MSAEIIPFPNDRGPNMFLDGMRRHVEHQQQRQELVRGVRRAAARSDKFKHDDEIRPAQYVRTLLREARAAKITQNMICEELNRRGRKVKLERVSISGASPQEGMKQKGADRLVKKVDVYVEVLDVLADLLGKSREGVIFYAFRDTDFWNQTNLPVDNRALRLSWLIDEMTQAIVRAERLHDYFNETRGTYARYCPVAEGFNPAPYQALWESGYEGYADYSWIMPPFPRVPLVRVRRASFSGPLLVEKQVIADASMPRGEVAREVSPRLDSPQPFGPHETVHADVTLYSDVRFVIGPRTRGDDLGPMLEGTSYVDLIVGGRKRPLTFDLSISTLGRLEDDEEAEVNAYVGTVAALFEDGWRRVTGINPNWSGIGDVEPGWGITLDSGLTFEGLLSEGGGGFEFPVGWEPVNASTIAKLVGLLSDSRNRLLFDHRVSSSSYESLHYREGGAAIFEDFLGTGGLEAELIAASGKLKAQLAAWLSQHEQAVEARTRAMLARWKSMER